MDSTNVGFIPQIADKLRDFFLRHHLMQTAQPLKHGHMQRRIGHHQHPLYFGLTISSMVLGASSTLIKPL
jgi:hypothetical protein